MPPAVKRRCANCGAAARARDRFCSSCGAALDVSVTRAQSLATTSTSLQVDSVAAAAFGEQRKVVTILFADLSGSTALGERLDPEELRGILGSYFNELARQIRRYEGTIDKYIGDAVMAVFGAPISHEDDAERAINAALAMQQSIGHLNDDLSRRHGVRLSLRIGINTGEVVAGLLAGDVQTAFTVVGDAVNTAQRFESAAPPGEVLVSADTRRLAIHSFEFEETAPLTLKGKAERVVGYRVIRRRYDEIAPESTHFIGRDAELEFLRAAVADAVQGRGRVVNVVGEAGIGKSRLVGELRANLVSGIDRLTVRCASFETNTPYALIADFIRGAFSIHAADDETVARTAITTGFAALGAELESTHADLLLDILGYGVRSPLDPEVKPRILVTLLRTLLTLAARRAPLVLTAEDLHWVDGASLRVLGDLVTVIPSLPLLFTTTARPGWTPPWQTETLAIRALEGAAARDLIETVFEVPVEDQLAETIIGRTAGNPFFIEEVVRALKASTLLIERKGRVALVPGATAPVPATIQELIEARIDRLSLDTRRTLNAGAVCGRTFWVRVLERLLPDVALAEHLVTLEHGSFVDLQTVSPEVTYGFRQILIQEVAYETQLQADRRRLHGSIAAAMEALYTERLDEFVDFLAYHYERSDDRASACRYLLIAGARAQRLYANDQAVRAYESALALAPDDTQRAAALEGIGDVRTTIGQLPRARDSYREAYDLAAAAIVKSRLERKVAVTYQREGDYQLALRWLERAGASAGDLVHADTAAVWIELAHVAWRQGRYDDALVAGERGVGIADAAGSRQLVAEGYKHLGTASVLKGDHARGVDLYRRALSIYESLDDPQGLMNVRNNLGIVFRRQSRWDEALEEQRQALTLARRIGDLWGVGMTQANLAETLRNRRDYPGAIAASEEALQSWSQVGNAVGVATVHMNLGILHYEDGHLDEARTSLGSALAEWEKLDSRLFLPELYRTLAKVELAKEPAVALGWALRSLDVAREIKARDEEGVALQVLGTVHHALGMRTQAAAELTESVSILRLAQNRLELARSLAALAQVHATAGRLEGDDLALVREAVTIFAELGATTDRRGVERLLAPPSPISAR
jgi:class 3 adenylate cyclase/tetratricopeptide (TPR) repeat protein